MARTVDEGFEGTGYEESWSETTTAGTVNEDSAGPGSLPPNGGSQCLRINKTSTSSDMVKTERTLSSAQAVTYCRFYLYIDDHNLGSDAAFDAIARMWEPSSNTVCTVQVGTSGTQLQLRIGYRDTTFTWAYTSAVNIAVDTWYCVEVRYDSTADILAWWLDGTQQGTNISVANGLFTIQGIALGGHYAVVTRTWDIYYDNVVVDNSSYIGPEEAAPPPARPRFYYHQQEAILAA